VLVQEADVRDLDLRPQRLVATTIGNASRMIATASLTLWSYIAMRPLEASRTAAQSPRSKRCLAAELVSRKRR
jgi:hypothetical protein